MTRHRSLFRLALALLVPFSLESRLGGVQRLLDATEALWHRRTFRVVPAAGRRTLLNFEAVDYRCEVFVNGRPAAATGVTATCRRPRRSTGSGTRRRSAC
jgi:hypothetical protein